MLQNSDFFEETHFNFAIFTENETFEVRFKDEVVFFESVKEKELSHTLIIEQMCRNERVFQLFPPIS